MNSPDVHTVVGRQADPLSEGENVLPSTHAAHERSAVDDPSCDIPEPIAHVFQALHVTLLPAEVLKCLKGQSAQTRSLLVVGT